MPSSDLVKDTRMDEHDVGALSGMDWKWRKAKTANSRISGHKNTELAIRQSAGPITGSIIARCL